MITTLSINSILSLYLKHDVYNNFLDYYEKYSNTYFFMELLLFLFVLLITQSQLFVCNWLLFYLNYHLLTYPPPFHTLFFHFLLCLFAIFWHFSFLIASHTI